MQLSVLYILIAALCADVEFTLLTYSAVSLLQTGYIDLEEFVCGLAVVLHGSFQDKCQLLFRMFNLVRHSNIFSCHGDSRAVAVHFLG